MKNALLVAVNFYFKEPNPFELEASFKRLLGHSLALKFSKKEVLYLFFVVILHLYER
jgi:hypothetical protein